MGSLVDSLEFRRVRVAKRHRHLGLLDELLRVRLLAELVGDHNFIIYLVSDLAEWYIILLLLSLVDNLLFKLGDALDTSVVDWLGWGLGDHVVTVLGLQAVIVIHILGEER